MNVAREDRSGRYMTVSLNDQKDAIELQTVSLGGIPDYGNDSSDSDYIEKSDHAPATLSKRHTGWRRGIIYCIATACLVLLCVLAFTGWAAGLATESASIRVLYRGNCKTSKNMLTATHVAINALSTLLLGASNYCMHIASAPSRRDIDKMHARKTVLDIGLNSVSNTFKLGWSRRIVWVLLGISSIPLHLMSNSVIYATTTAYKYVAAVVTDDFFQGANWTTSALKAYRTPPPIEWNAWMEDVQRGDIQLTELDIKVCVEAYATPFVTRYGNVILTADRHNSNTTIYDNNSLLTVEYGNYNESDAGNFLTNPSYGWMCAQNALETGWDYIPACSAILADPLAFKLEPMLPIDYNETDGSYGWDSRVIPIDGCFSQRLDEKCTVETSLFLMGVIIAFISCKTLCMFWILWRLKEYPLAVVGDAIASFMEESDENTKGACLGAASTFNHPKSWQKTLKWSSKPNRWLRNVSGGQWTTCILLCILALSIATYLLVDAVINFYSGNSLKTSPIRISGFHTLHPSFMMLSVIRSTDNSTSSLLPAVLLANLPQLIVSFIYISYNSVWTSMLMGLEWSQYAYIRRTLRVSYPNATQRSSYRLQIPYRYGVPLMVLIGSIHMLISESIFVVRVRVLTTNGEEDPYQSFVTCGYSLLALLVTIIVGTVAVIGVIAFGFRRYKPGMSLVRCSSAAISAACHPRPNENRDAALRSLQWGAVPTDGEIGHCCFSTESVVMPTEGSEYA